MRLLYRDQRDALVAELTRRLPGEVMVVPPDQGVHVVAYLRDGRSDVDLEAAARAHGIVVRAISRLYKEAPARSGLLLGFTGYPRQTIIPAAARLARVIAAQSPA
jgi:GntR family transcriptional regulator/MocR family aminotransferase